MLNTSVNIGRTVLNFNAVSGTLIKSTAKSKFKRFHMESKLAGYFFGSTPTFDGYRSTAIEVLQVMLCGDSEFLVEYIFVSDLED